MGGQARKRRLGIKLTLVGIVIGIITGFGILALQSFIVSELHELLNDEAKKACDCTFAATSIDVSLLTLSGRATNARIMRNGEPRLLFAVAEAKFSLSRLTEKLLVLSDLHLQDGVAYNVDEDSVTFKFIDSISTLPPPELRKKDRWKLYLQQLRVSNSRFAQDFPGTYITGNSISLFLERNAEDNFDLKPVIGNLALTLKRTATRPSEKTIQLGKVTSRITLEDSRAVFEKLRVVTERSVMKANAISDTTKGNALTGSADLLIDTFLLQLSDFLNTKLRSESEITGSLGNPGLKGTFSLAHKKAVPFTVNEIPLFDLENITGSYSYDLNHGNHRLNIPDLSGSGPDTSVEITRPLTLKDDVLDAGFAIEVGSFVTEGISIDNIKASVALGDTLDAIGFSVQGRAEKALVGKFFFPPLDFSIQNKPDLHFSIGHASTTSGSFSLTGTLVPEGSRTVLENGRLTMENLSLAQELAPEDQQNPDVLKKLVLSGAITLSGPLSFYQLNGDGAVTITSRHFAGEAALTGKVGLKDGTLSAEVFNRIHSFDGNLKVNFQQATGSAQLRFQAFRPTEYFPDARCLEVTASADYSFPLANPAEGNGDIKIDNVSLGCKPYEVQLKQAQHIPIRGGKAQIANLRLSSTSTDFTVNGMVSTEQVDVTTNGKLFLNTLLGFIPTLDDLSGTLDASISIRGTLAQPVFDGSATITEGEFSSEASDLIASNMSGSLSLKDSIVTVDYLNGTVNAGTLSVIGSADLTDFSQATLDIQIEQMAINSVEDVTLTITSSLQVARGEKVPRITGQVIIDSLEARKNINLPSILKAIVKSPIKDSSPQPLGELPQVELDVTVTAPRNIFIISNFLTAEFSADFSLSGTLNKPVILGGLTSQSGWLGLKNRRFQITSGLVSFSKDPTNPDIEIIGETSVFGNTGEFVTIILEATGTLATPEIGLSSDTGLTQVEILNLLTSNAREVESTRANAFSDQDSENSLSLVEDRPGNVLRKTLHSLTTLDELTVEPALNNRTGAIEPALTATKRIADDVAIIGNTFVGPEPSSRVRLRYDLTPFLNIATSIDSINTDQNSSLGVDLTYTVFARKVPFVEYDIEGTDNFGTLDLLKEVRLSNDSRIRPEELSNLTKRFEKYYNDQGFLHALAVLDCVSVDNFCRKVQVKIFEGPQATISGRRLIGDALPPEVPESRIPSVPIGADATTEVLNFQQQRVIETLRSEGYLSARVQAYYQESGSHDVRLILELTVGNQDSFIFSGNSVFSPEEFLETINLFNRKQPFGRNTIRILIENMERMYREEGYLFASIDYDKEINPETKKTTYYVRVNEEIPVEISKIIFSGNTNISLETMQQILRQNAPERYLAVFEPTTVVAERILESCSLLESLYKIQGYPQATVTYAVYEDDSERRMILEYSIQEGAPLIFSKISVHHFPDELSLPEFPAPPLSVPRVNQYVETINQRLKDEGFQEASVQTLLENDAILVVTHPGPATSVGMIRIEGLGEVPESTIYENLTFRTGDPWTKEQLQQSRRSLLLLGLFSRVEISPADGTASSGVEDILVRVVERPLTTLEIGGGLNSELGVHTFGEAVDKSIFLDGSSLGTRLDLFVNEQDGSVTRGVAGLRYTRPQFLGTDFQLTQDARFQKTDLTTLEYDLERYILDSALYRRFTDDLTLNLSYSLLQDNVSNVPDGAILSDLDEGIVNLSLLGAAFRWDRRDSPVVPTEGFALSFDPRFTSEAIGSDANFYSMSGRVGFLYPFFTSPFSIAEHFKIGSAWTFGDTSEIPITQRYYLGGRQSIRGFRENSLGPRGSDGSVIGGDVLVQNNFEIRYRLQETLSTHIFLDAGNVFLKSEEVDLSDLRTGVGFGARYLSPIGPIGFDIGHPLDERPGEPSVRFHFSIGSNF